MAASRGLNRLLVAVLLIATATGAGAAVTASAATSDSAALIVARGADEAAWIRTSDGVGNWSGWSSLGGRLTQRPSAARLPDGRIAVFGLGLDGAAWSRTTLRPADLRAWGPWETLGGAVANLTPLQPALPSTGQLVLLAAGRDGRVWSRSFERNGTWASWAPAGTARYNGGWHASWRLASGFVDVVGCVADGNSPCQMRVDVLNDRGESTSAFQRLGGAIANWLPPRIQGTAAASTIGDYVGVSYLSDSSLGLWRTGLPYFDTVGGAITGVPSFGPAESVLARGRDGGVWSWEPAEGWSTLGGRTPDDPVVAQVADDAFVLAVRGLDDGVWVRSNDGEVWSPWQPLGGLVLEAPFVLDL